MRPRKFTIEDVREMTELINSGWTYKQICDKFGIHVSTVNHWVKRLKLAGVKLTNKPGHRPLKLDNL